MKTTKINYKKSFGKPTLDINKLMRPIPNFVTIHEREQYKRRKLIIIFAIILVLSPLTYMALKIRFSNPQLTETQLLIEILSQIKALWH